MEKIDYANKNGVENTKMSELMKILNKVQGMNEILAPIYYCYSIGNFDNTSTEYIEADTYWSFSNLMEDIKGMFIKEKDNDKTGIFNKIQSDYP